MARVAVFASCTEDEISLGGERIAAPGGPGTYCSLTARRLRAGVDLYTRMGPGGARALLEDEGVTIHGRPAAEAVRFALDVRGGERTLRLLRGGEPIEYSGMGGADGAIVTPVCGEVSAGTLASIKADSEFTLVDPQGFLRRVGEGGAITLAQTAPDLDGVSAIKADMDELAALVGDGGARALSGAGVGHVLVTSGRDISMLSGDREYRLSLPVKDVADTTGVGDIFSAAFCATMLRERDALWAFCFACGAAHAALDTREAGPKKVPARRAIETNAAYFYNTVEFSGA
ncbi:MAG: PfkB family carbohydrate kinase [Thaumarchaeota archaeon]|nr:PfkB family carbohydrate kinase [Nitrososphaerota archaeon]